jgi:hypothetical protein
MFRLSFTFFWFYLLGLLLTSLVSFTIFLNIFLKLQDIVHEGLDKFKNEATKFNIGNVLSYFSLNISAICLGVYFTLVTLKMDGFITTEWNVVAIPLFVLSGVGM